MHFFHVKRMLWGDLLKYIWLNKMSDLTTFKKHRFVQEEVDTVKKGFVLLNMIRLELLIYLKLGDN
jgi:hypothetical protein